MDFKNNKFKKCFLESDMELLLELSWEQMEEGIFEKMEALEVKLFVGGFNCDIIKMIFMLLLCLLFVFFFNNGLLLDFKGLAFFEFG